MDIEPVAGLGALHLITNEVGYAPARTQVRAPLALVVDQDPRVRVQLAEVLEDEGWLAIVADSPELAIRVVRDLALDLLVTGAQLSGMAGADLAAHLRDREPTLPVLMVSAGGDAAFEPAPPSVVVATPSTGATFAAAIRHLTGRHEPSQGADRPSPPAA